MADFDPIEKPDTRFENNCQKLNNTQANAGDEFCDET